MLHPSEAEFIRRYIAKNKRERLRFELSDPSRRARTVHRFAHTAEDFLAMSKAALLGDDISKDRVASMLTKGANSNGCHVVLSDGSTLELSVKDAVAVVYGDGPAIVIAENSVYIETEPWTPTMRYVLSEKSE